MIAPLRVLLVEDSEDDALLVQAYLQQSGFELATFRRVDSRDALMEALQGSDWDLLLSDYQLPGFSGLGALEALQEIGLDIPFILISGKVGEDTAVDAMKKGAHDYVSKNNLARLVPAINRELREAETRHQRRLANARLAESETKFRTLFHHASDAIFFHEQDGTIIEVNATACQQLGYTRETLLGRNLRDLMPNAALGGAFDALRSGEQANNIFEAELTALSGERTAVEMNMREIEFEGRPCFLAVARDISERKLAERRILQLTNLYAALSQTNEAIVRASDRDILMGEICQITVKYGQLDCAWILWTADGANGGVIAQHGVSREQAIQLSTESSPIAGMLTVRALQQNHHYVNNECEGIADDAGNPFRSMAIFPLQQLKQTVGAMVLLSREPEFFSEALVALLHEMAIDIDFALDSFIRETRRREAENRLSLAYKVFENSSEAILIVDAQRRLISVNRAYTQITGYESDEVLGTVPDFLAAGHLSAALEQSIADGLAATGHWQGETPSRRKNGECYPQWLSINEIREGDSISHYIGIFSDISERKEAEEKIRFLAHFDTLTGLPNRVLLESRLELLFAKAQRDGTYLAVLFLDLDRFKTINDSLGHHIGDELLRAVSERLKGALRTGDLLTRWGGDEFIIVLTDLRQNEIAARVANKLIELNRIPYAVDQHSLNVTLSIGISIFPDDGNDMGTLVKSADMAMYHAKDGGRDNYCFYALEMNAVAQERLIIENQLRQAVGRKELCLFYQPQIDNRTGRIVGAEALLRWNHPEHGLLLPERFIPMAEDCGLIVPIGEWVLETACQQILHWRTMGLDLPRIAVNLSAVQFRQPDLAARIARILESTGMVPGNVELEITERVWMRDIENTEHTLGALKAMGIQIALDDFGTGFSGLSYLKQYPVTRLKIDKSFIADALRNPDDTSIVKAIIDLVANLRLEVIAEGVETAEQQEFLSQHGCHEMQGFLFRTPVPPDEFAELLKHQPFVHPMA